MQAFVGRWRITRTDLWGDEDLDLIGRPEIAFDRRGGGSIRVGALEAELDHRVDKNAGVLRLEFTWSGYDEMDPVSGRGWVEIEGASMRGKVFIHMGEEIEFNAVRQDGKQRR